jgi:non-heme chloroperoxidase
MQAMYHADHRAGLATISVPTLVVHGAADTSAPVELTGRRTAELIPNARYVEYPTAGHGLHVTHAAQLNAELFDLVKR